MHVFWLPLLVFVVVAGWSVVRFVIFARKFRISVRPGEEGAALHIETAAGNLDLEPRKQLDSRFASFVFYPGARPQIAGSPEYVASGGPLGNESRCITATCWTNDLSGKVLDFYRSQLAQWTQTREWLGSAGHAWTFTDPADPGRSIRIREESARNPAGTVIEYSIDLGAPYFTT